MRKIGGDKSELVTNNIKNMTYSDLKSKIIAHNNDNSSILELSNDEITVIGEHLNTLDGDKVKKEIEFILDNCLDTFQGMLNHGIRKKITSLFIKYPNLSEEILEDSVELMEKEQKCKLTQ